jgi:hypothetical protein
MKRENQKLLFLCCFLLLSTISIVSYELGKKHAEEKPPQIIVEYIDDKCLCVKCGKRMNFQEVQHLIQKIK